MPQREFIAWMDFYRLYPFDDFHRYHRPAALVSVSLGGGDVQQRLDWLHPLPAASDPDFDLLSLLKG